MDTERNLLFFIYDIYFILFGDIQGFLMQSFKFISRLTIILIIAFQLCFVCEATAGIKDKIGGSGGNTSNEKDDSGSSLTTVLYVVVGVAVALVAYKYFSEKDEETEESDSTEAMLMQPLQDYSSSFDAKVQKVQQEIPFDVELGMSKTLYNDQRFQLGLKIKL